jgi:uncharacterized membrane protein
VNDEATLSEDERLYLDRAFTYHAPTENQPALYQQVRAEARQLAALIMLIAPHSRERAVALTNLEQSVMWANAAIARNP